MVKKFLNSFISSAQTLNTRAGREDLFGYRSKRNERDRKLKSEANQIFSDANPEFGIGGDMDDYDGYVQYRKGYAKSCILIENQSSVKNYYYKLLKDKTYDEVAYEFIKDEDIPQIHNLLSDGYKWEMYFEFYKSAFKICYAQVWLHWIVDEFDKEVDIDPTLLIRKSKEKILVESFILDSIKNREIPVYSLADFKKLDDCTQYAYIANALNVLGLPRQITHLEWQTVNQDDIEFSKSYVNNYYQYYFWGRIFWKKYSKNTGSQDDLENFLKC